MSPAVCKRETKYRFLSVWLNGGHSVA